MLKTLKKIKASEIEVIAVAHQKFLWKGLLLVTLLSASLS